jgi:hypothetical protein
MQDIMHRLLPRTEKEKPELDANTQTYPNISFCGDRLAIVEIYHFRSPEKKIIDTDTKKNSCTTQCCGSRSA